MKRPYKASAGGRKIENVLILQGGGSLGAFGCGVFKALANRDIKIDIVAGTSIGGVNAAIIAGGGKNGDRPEQLLENFWLELSDSFVSLNDYPDYSSYAWGARLLAQSLSNYFYPSPPGRSQE